MSKKLLPTVLVLVAVAAACSKTGGTAAPSASKPAANYPMTLTTDAGTATLPARPERIVSLSPTATEMLFAIGAGDQVVAVDDQSNYPPQAPMTKLSGFTPNVEAIASYHPDLVVIVEDPGGLVRSLKNLNIPVMMEPTATTLDDSYAQIQQLGEATGHAAQAASVSQNMKAQIAQIVASVPKPSTPLTFYHELDDTYYSVTSKTFIGQVYAMLGLKNIADAAQHAGSGYPQLSAEYILSANPDLIFLADAECCKQDAQTVAARPGWGQLDAVKNGNVIVLNGDVASRWGPRVVDFFRTIADAVRVAESPSP